MYLGEVDVSRNRWLSQIYQSQVSTKFKKQKQEEKRREQSLFKQQSPVIAYELRL